MPIQDPKQIVPPDTLRMLDEQQRQILLAMNCVKIGVIQTFDPGDATHAPTVTAKVAQKQVSDILNDGTQILADYPPLVKCPVYFPSGGGFTITFPIAQGDECLILFNDRQLDNWLSSGPGLAPSLPRVHDIADGIALVGLRSNPRALASVSATAVQLRSDDHATIFEIAPGKISLIADEIVIHSRNKLAYDAGGTGTVIQTAQIDNYTDGVAVNNHSPTPPAVPS